MAASIFPGGHENRIAQVLALPLAGGASGNVLAKPGPFVLFSLVDGYEIRGNTGFKQSLCLPFAKAAVSNAQKKFWLLLANSAN